jgi:hypothetical protein
MATPDRAEKLAFPLDEVAEMTGLSLRSLQDGCRANPPRVPHRRYGQQRVMTLADVEQFLAGLAVDSGAAAAADQLDEYRRKVADRLAARSRTAPDRRAA